MKDRAKIVYLVRHGQSVDNVSPVFQSTKSPLSEAGKNQAEKLAERLSKLEFEVLISSPVIRARQTAQYIADKTHKDVIESDLFVERVKPSEIQGKPYTDAKANKVWHDWNESLYQSGKRISDGENFDDLAARADTALAYLLKRPETSLVVVTHGYFLLTIVAQTLLGKDLTPHAWKKIRPKLFAENTAITVLKYADAFEEEFQWRLWTLNDHAHFAE